MGTMNTFKSWTLVAAAVAGLVTLVGGGNAAAAGDPTKRTESVIVIDFPKCEGCKVTAWHARPSAVRPSFWSATVRNGKAVITVPTSKTVGMSFDFETPKSASALGGDAAPVIAIGFKGVPAGSTVTRSQTRAPGAQANWCWTGTSSRKAVITVDAYRVTVPGTGAASGPQIYAWASPTVKTWHDSKNMQAADAMGDQDAPFCS